MEGKTCLGYVWKFVSGRFEGILGGLLKSARWSAPNATGCAIRGLPRAFELVKGMQAQGWNGAGAIAISAAMRLAVPRGQMSQTIDERLDRMAALDQTDRRNGSIGAICLPSSAISRWGYRALAVSP